MNPIRLPRAAAKLRAFAEIVTETHGRAIEIRQDEAGAMLTVADGHQLARITAPPPAGTTPGTVERFLVDARDFAKAAAAVGCSRTEALVSAAPYQVSAEDRPLLVVRIDDKKVGVAGPEGSPQTIPVESGRMPDAMRIVNGIRAQAIDGTTKAVARVDPRFLQNVADTAVAMGIGTVEITCAPSLNCILFEGSGPDGCHAEFAIAGIGEIDFEAIAKRDRPAWEQDDALIFTMPEDKPKKAAPRRKKVEHPLLPLDDIPF